MRRLVAAKGGGAVVVDGGGSGPFNCGVRTRPVATALEFLFAVLNDECYERVLCATATGPLVPKDIQVDPRFRLGLHSGVWLLRGKPIDETTPAAPKPPPNADPDDFRFDDFSESRLASHAGQAVGLFTDDRTWSEAIDVLRGWVEPYLESNARRTLLIVDEDTLLPKPAHIQAGITTNPANSAAAADWLSKLPQRIKGTAVDVVLLVGSERSAADLANGRFVRGHAERLLQRLSHRPLTPDQISLDAVVTCYPQIHWPDVPCVKCEAFDEDAPHSPFFGRASPNPSLFEVLRTAEVAEPKARLRKPDDPRQVLYEFWAGMDVDGLKMTLEREVIGQRAAIETTADALRSFKAKCGRALQMLRAGKSAPDTEDFFPPVFLFMGPSGMGKTFVARRVAKFLLGETFYEEVPAGGQNVGNHFVGVAGGYQGCDSRPPFLSFCKRTNGAGVVVFDELDKVQRLSNERLSDALNVLLLVLQNRWVQPTNDELVNYGDGRCWFRNTLMIFTANVVDDNPPPGYVALADFGTPFLRRITCIRFNHLAHDDIVPSTSYLIKKLCDGVLRQALIENQQVVVSQAVVERIAKTFDTETAKPNRQNFRTLGSMETCVKHCIVETSLLEKFCQGTFALDIADLNPKPWQAVAGG
ncbi:MAG: AAA family ATPase [Pirellulales bacterium]